MKYVRGEADPAQDVQERGRCEEQDGQHPEDVCDHVEPVELVV